MVFWCILFWILAHKHENHKWMFFIGFNGGLASGFSTKKPSDGWSHGPSVYLNIPKEMAETPWYFNKFQTMDGRLYFKRGGKKNKGFWHSITFIESKLHVAVLCHWSKARDEMRQDATSHGNNLSSVPLHGRSSFWSQSLSCIRIHLSDMSSKINQHEPDINQQWTMTLMNIFNYVWSTHGS